MCFILFPLPSERFFLFVIMTDLGKIFIPKDIKRTGVFSYISHKISPVIFAWFKQILSDGKSDGEF